MLKQWKITKVVLASLLLTSLNLIAGRGTTAQAQVTIDCSTLSSGYANGENSGVTLSGAVGQWVVNNNTVGDSQLISGGAAMIETCRGGGIQPVYLPALTRPIPSRALITNDTGGILKYRITLPDYQPPPQDAISCDVPAGADNYFCDRTFTPGRYEWHAEANCGISDGIRTYLPGPNEIHFFCN